MEFRYWIGRLEGELFGFRTPPGGLLDWVRQTGGAYEVVKAGPFDSWPACFEAIWAMRAAGG